VTDLERALTELADHLDIASSPDAGEVLTRRLAGIRPHRRHSRVRVLLAAAAAVAVMSAGVTAIAPARHAVAGWLCIGAVEIRHQADPVVPTVSSTTNPTPTSSTRPPIVPLDLAGAQKAVNFTIVTPRGEAPPLAVAVDRRVPDGLVVLTYSHFTLVEIATDTTQPPPLGKLVGNAAVEQVQVHGHDGMWIAEPHTIAYLDRAGHFKYDTVRRAGPVLLWERDGVTYRVEGPHTLDEAMTIANSII